LFALPSRQPWEEAIVRRAIASDAARRHGSGGALSSSSSTTATPGFFEDQSSIDAPNSNSNSSNSSNGEGTTRPSTRRGGRHGNDLIEGRSSNRGRRSGGDSGLGATVAEGENEDNDDDDEDNDDDDKIGGSNDEHFKEKKRNAVGESDGSDDSDDSDDDDDDGFFDFGAPPSPRPGASASLVPKLSLQISSSGKNGSSGGSNSSTSGGHNNNSSSSSSNVPPLSAPRLNAPLKVPLPPPPPPLPSSPSAAKYGAGADSATEGIAPADSAGLPRLFGMQTTDDEGGGDDGGQVWEELFDFEDLDLTPQVGWEIMFKQLNLYA
jgi:hypothetical protein